MSAEGQLGTGDGEGEAREAESERALRAARLGYELTRAHEFDVYAPDGRRLGTLDRLRYERHADHPDEIIVRSHRLLAWPRRSAIPFDTVESVDVQRGRIRLRRLPTHQR